jgi:hypothetical protein
VPGGYTGIGVITNAAVGARSFGPVADHTTGEPSGYYFWFSKTMKNQLIYKTNVVINDLPPTGLRPQCLKFWYQMNTPTVQSFYIYVVPVDQTNYDTPLWTVPYNNFSRWTRGQLTVNANYKHKIVLSLYLSAAAPMNSFIALDDISLTTGQCEPPVSCDFDVDMCSWMNAKTDQANWNWDKFTGNSMKFPC